MSAATLRIAITPGEPAGIGPDLLVRLVQQPQTIELVAIADPQLLSERAAQLGLPLTIETFDPATTAQVNKTAHLKVFPVALYEPVQCGVLNAGNAAYVLECLDKAVEGCQDNTFAAMVTGPVHKGIINEAGFSFTGHTEYLAEKTNTDQVVMMLTTEGLRVALATTHLPLNKVSEHLTREHLENVIRILHQDLVRRFGLAHPHITVCGLNPHAGEQGHIGHEEITVINPVLDKLRNEGLQLDGPLPADTVFVPYHLSKTDCVLSMYHDQGLPVLKHMGFGQAVNVTLGLPVIRTSVDHGTALEKAGSEEINIGSLQAAILQASEMANRHSG
ncbi:MAG: 4-hydroxythreonine-4-phosphate dehydrogenase PdxA [Gammaproteobacteria bacterium]